MGISGPFIACTAYTRYVLDIGQSEDWLGLQISLAPCLLGYGAIAKQLHADVRTKTEGNTVRDPFPFTPFSSCKVNIVARQLLRGLSLYSG